MHMIKSPDYLSGIEGEEALCGPGQRMGAGPEADFLHALEYSPISRSRGMCRDIFVILFIY